MDILYKRHFGRLRLLRASDVEKNPEPRASRRLCCAVYTNFRSQHRNLSDLSLDARGGYVFFVLRLLSLPGATFTSL